MYLLQATLPLASDTEQALPMAIGDLAYRHFNAPFRDEAFVRTTLYEGNSVVDAVMSRSSREMRWSRPSLDIMVMY